MSKSLFELLDEKGNKHPGFSDEYIKDYCLELTNLNLAELLNELNLTASQQEVYDNELKDNLVNNATTFLKIANQSKQMSQQLEVIDSQISDFEQKFEIVENSVEIFNEKRSNLMSHHRILDNFLLSDDKKIMQLLEINNLIRSCIDFNKFDLAFDLINYLKRLNAKHSNVLILQNLVSEAEVLQGELFQKILLKLRSNLDLAVCLQLISFLRQNSVLSETEIKIEFIRARNVFLDNRLRLAEKSSKEVLVRINKMIEAYRSCLFEIISQFRIISDSESDPNTKSQLLFHNWVHMRLRQFIKSLETILKEDRNNSHLLNHIFKQCMYFGTSFSRIGYDFRPLLMPTFLNLITFYFRCNLNENEVSFRRTLNKSLHKNSIILTENWLEGVLKCYPLAYYCNGVLNAFNELQKFFFDELIFQIKSLLEQSLKNVWQLIKHCDDKEGLLDCFSNEVVPFLQNCFKKLVSFDDVCKIFDLSASHVQNLIEFDLK